jgi:serine/threonine-protein kinase
MSPEQAAGEETLDARCDVYSLGALGYCLLSGRPPFGSRPVVKLLAAHLYESPRRLTDSCPALSSDLDAVVLRCLAKDPADRYSSAASLDAALAACRGVMPWTTEDGLAWWGLHSIPVDGRVSPQGAGSTAEPATVSELRRESG